MTTSESAGTGSDDGSTEVVVSHVPAQRVPEYEAMRDELDADAARFAGFIDVHRYRPAPGENTWTTVLRFASPEDLQRWRASDERRRGVARMHTLAQDEAKVMPTGFGQWFAVDSTAVAQTPAWKQAMVVVAVLFAMVSVLNITLGNLVGSGLSVEGTEVFAGLNLPFPMVVFIGNAVGTVLMTWVLMPVITRLMAWWLSPDATSRQTWWGVVLLIVIYVLEVGFFTLVNESLGF
jgi:uncharacterized protein